MDAFRRTICRSAMSARTSSLDALLKIITAKGIKVALAAPTGRARKRMSEQTGLEGQRVEAAQGAH
jgi:ATP-dependent exoDNAse (exonuclease V) alpha subunit